MTAPAWPTLTTGHKAEILLTGACGAMAPIWVGMARQALQAGFGKLSITDGLMITHVETWLACALLGLIGAIVVRAYKETRTDRALVLGAAAPALILGFANGSPETGPGRPEDLTLGLLSWVVRPAYAQEARQLGTQRVADTVRARRSDSVYVILRGATESRYTTVSAVAGVRTPRGAGPEMSQPITLRDTVVGLPAWATEFHVSVGGSATEIISVEALRALGDSVVVSLEVKEPGNFWSRFGRALGFRTQSRPEVSLSVRGGPGQSSPVPP